MNANLTIVLISAVVATFNPSLLAAVTIMLLLPQRKRLMLGYLLGAYTTSIVAGLAIVFALHRSGVVTTSKRTISPGEDMAIGGLALAAAVVLITGADLALRHRRELGRQVGAEAGAPQPPWHERMLDKGSARITFVVGALVSLPGVSYVNALDHVVMLNPPRVAVLALVLYFCLMQQLLLEVPLVATVFAPDQTQRAVVQTKAWFGRHGRTLAQTALSGIGILLVVRGVMALH
jgi:hypothetical protein